MSQVSDERFWPVTVFLPSDGVMASLPQEQKDFLFHQHNRRQLVEYLKFHILQNQKVKTAVNVFECGGNTVCLVLSLKTSVSKLRFTPKA